MIEVSFFHVVHLLCAALWLGNFCWCWLMVECYNIKLTNLRTRHLKASVFMRTKSILYRNCFPIVSVYCWHDGLHGSWTWTGL